MKFVWSLLLPAPPTCLRLIWLPLPLVFSFSSMDIIRDEDDDPGDDEEGRPGDAADDDMFLFFLTTPPGRGATESSVLAEPRSKLRSCVAPMPPNPSAFRSCDDEEGDRPLGGEDGFELELFVLDTLPLLPQLAVRILWNAAACIPCIFRGWKSERLEAIFTLGDAEDDDDEDEDEDEDPREFPRAAAWGPFVASI